MHIIRLCFQLSVSLLEGNTRAPVKKGYAFIRWENAKLYLHSEFLL